MKKEDIYYQAMLARDHRFDGKFFIGVKTTGIYCRPICPAKPKRENVEFFASHVEAESAGYRPCLRCRPESAPQSSAWVGTSAIVRRAVKMIHHLDTLEFDEDKFAARFGVSARHLRRVFVEEIGKTPKQLCFENRLNLARKLITETGLAMTEIAFASGFQSIRRFNDSFKERFKKSPTEIRRNRVVENGPLRISLPYRPPFNFEALMRAYENHRIGDLEVFENNTYRRFIAAHQKTGWITVSNRAEQSRLEIEIDFADTSVIHSVVNRVRSMFDLDSDPVVIANALEIDPKIKSLLKKHSGIRLFSGWDSFETAISVILGQLVTVDRGRGLVAELIELLGEGSGVFNGDREVKLFPSPERLAESSLEGFKTTNARKQTLIAFAKAIVSGEISLDATQDVEEFEKKLMSIKGIGAWTASYMALKVIRHTDAFPVTDLIIARALELHSSAVIAQMSPWRAYVAALFWREYHGVLVKKKKKEVK